MYAFRMDTLQAYTAKQAADVMNCSINWIKNEIRSGRLRAHRIGFEYRITRGALEEYQDNSSKKMQKELAEGGGIYGRKPYLSARAQRALTE